MPEQRTQAWNELHDPTTTASRLMEIAHAYPEFADAIVAHPQVYPELTAWLAETSQAAAEPVTAAVVPERDAIAEELADPATSAARLMEIAQQYPARGDAIVAHPAAYPALVEWIHAQAAAVAAAQGHATPVAPAPVAAAVATSASVLEPEPAPAPEPAQQAPPTDPDEGPLKLPEHVMKAVGDAAAHFDDVGLGLHLLQALSSLHQTVRGALQPGEIAEFVVPVVWVEAEPLEASLLFTRSRIVVIWRQGMRASSGRYRAFGYDEVQSARIGAAPSATEGELALYVQARDTLIFVLPSDVPAEVEILAQLARGVPLAVAKPEDDPELAAARAELAEPTIAGSRLVEIAAAHPELHVELAGHPRSYPELLDWLASRPDVRTQQAVAARRARDTDPASVSPVAQSGVSHPEPAPAAPVMARKSGWEHAENAIGKAERAGEIVGTILTVIYGIFLIVVGIAIAILAFSMGHGFGWLGIVVAIYGVYVALPLPGYKMVIW